MNIITWMIEDGLAQNEWQARHIIAGLELYKLHRDGKYEEIKQREQLYGDWRNAGEPSKVAYAKAIVGEAVPQPMFDGILHTVVKQILTTQTLTK